MQNIQDKLAPVQSRAALTAVFGGVSILYSKNCFDGCQVFLDAVIIDSAILRYLSAVASAMMSSCFNSFRHVLRSGRTTVWFFSAPTHKPFYAWKLSHLFFASYCACCTRCSNNTNRLDCMKDSKSQDYTCIVCSGNIAIWLFRFHLLFLLYIFVVCGLFFCNKPASRQLCRLCNKMKNASFRNAFLDGKTQTRQTLRRPYSVFFCRESASRWRQRSCRRLCRHG